MKRVNTTRHAPVVQTHGPWTLTITDDLPIEPGKPFATDLSVELTHATDPELNRSGIVAAYKQWTLLAHWTDGLDS